MSRWLPELELPWKLFDTREIFGGSIKLSLTKIDPGLSLSTFFTTPVLRFFPSSILSVLQSLVMSKNFSLLVLHFKQPTLVMLLEFDVEASLSNLLKSFTKCLMSIVSLPASDFLA